MAITLERSALYEEVWSEPLTKLAKKHGLSDNGLRKICKAMNIPLPSAGHWAKVAAGHQIRRTPLPAEAECTSYTSHTPSQKHAPFHTPADDAWLADQDAYEKRVDGVITVDAVDSLARRSINTSSTNCQAPRGSPAMALLRSACAHGPAHP